MLPEETAKELNVPPSKITSVMRTLGIKGSKRGTNLSKLDLDDKQVHRIKSYLHAEAQYNEAGRKFDFVVEDLKNLR